MGPIAYVFDRGHKHRTELLQVLSQCKDADDLRAKFKLGRIAQGDKLEAIPLQAADLIAWETRKLLTDKIRKPRRSLLELYKAPHSWARLDEEGLDRYIQLMDLPRA